MTIDLSSLDEFVGKYVEMINEDNGQSMAGWVAKVDSDGKTKGRIVMLDYGMGMLFGDNDTHKTIIREIEPPKDDPGIFNFNDHPKRHSY